MWRDILTFRGRWGRLNRQRFFLYKLVPIGIILVIFLSYSLLGRLFPVTIETTRPVIMVAKYFLFFFGLLTTLLVIWSRFSLDTKRLHDLNHSAWWLLIGFIPIVSIFYTIYLFFWTGSGGANKYGSDPLKQ